jgi:hypothetical protein
VFETALDINNRIPFVAYSFPCSSEFAMRAKQAVPRGLHTGTFLTSFSARSHKGHSAGVYDLTLVSRSFNSSSTSLVGCKDFRTMSIYRLTSEMRMRGPTCRMSSLKQQSRFLGALQIAMEMAGKEFDAEHVNEVGQLALHNPLASPLASPPRNHPSSGMQTSLGWRHPAYHQLSRL